MNLVTIMVSALIAVAAAAAVVKIRKDRRCNAGCGGCALSGNCGKQKKIQNGR